MLLLISLLKKKMVSWCSRLSHVSHTHGVLSSSLSETILFAFFLLFVSSFLQSSLNTSRCERRVEVETRRCVHCFIHSFLFFGRCCSETELSLHIFVTHINNHSFNFSEVVPVTGTIFFKLDDAQKV